MRKRSKLSVILVLSFFIMSVLPLNAFAATFNDAAKVPAWAVAAVNELAAAGVLAGDENGNFNPLNNVTRAEAAKVIVAAKGLTLVNPATASFSDVEKGKWFYTYVETAKAAGIVEGNAGKFNPNAKVTRQELAKMFVAAEGTAVDANATLTYSDAAAVANWAVPYVAAAKELGLMVGANNKFNPTATAIRAELAQIGSNFLGLATAELKVVSVSAINAKELVVKFSKAVDEDTIVEESGINKDTLVDNVVTLEKVGAALSIASINDAKGTLSADGRTLTIRLASTDYMDGDYVLTVAKDKILSMDSSKLEYVKEYTSPLISMEDSVEPTVAKVERVHAAQYKVVFSEPMASYGTLKAKYADGTDVTAKVSADATDLMDRELVLNLTTDDKKEVTVTLTGARDYNVNLLNPNPYSFKVTKLEKDGVAPEVSSLVVVNPFKLEIKFNEEVQKFDPSDISINTVALTDGVDKVEQNETDKSKFLITLNSGLSNGFHTLAITANAIADVTGEPIKAYSKVFEVKEDTVAPKLTAAKVVKDGRDGLEYLVLTFDKDVVLDKLNLTNMKATGLVGKQYEDYVTTAVTVKIGAAETTGFVKNGDLDNEYKIALTKLVVDGTTPTSLDKDAKYTLDLPASAVKNLTGKANDKQDAAIVFTRGSDVVVTGQEVLKVVTKIFATSGTADSTLSNSELTVVFAKEVDGASATNIANYAVDGAVVKTAELQADKLTVKLTLEKGQTGYTGARYITVNNVKTKNLEAMAKAYRAVIELNENMAPTVTAVNVTGIANNTDTTKYDVTVKLTFSEKVLNASNANDFQVLVGGKVDATVSATVLSQLVSTSDEDVLVTFTIAKTDYEGKTIELDALSTIDIADAAGNKVADSAKATVK